MSAGRTVGRWLIRIGAALVVLVVVCAGVVYGASEWRMRAHLHIPAHPYVAPAADARTLALGRHEAIIHGCTDCHGDDFGGRVFVENGPIGRFVASNITRGADGPPLTDQDWEVMVRHGVARDGRKLKVMPAEDYAGLSDEELGAIVAYARSLPPVHKPLPGDAVGPLGRALFLAGLIPLLPAERVTQDTRHVARVAAEPTARFGAYLIPSCTGCHGRTLSGGKIPGMPPNMLPASNLTPDPTTGIGSWTEDDFVRAMHTGVRPDTSVIDSVDMPLKVSREMTDTEVRALYRYLRTVPAKPYGSR